MQNIRNILIATVVTLISMTHMYDVRAENYIPFIVEKPKPKEVSQQAKLVSVVEVSAGSSLVKRYRLILELPKPTTGASLLIYDNNNTHNLIITDSDRPAHYAFATRLSKGTTHVTIEVEGTTPPGDHFGAVEVGF